MFESLNDLALTMLGIRPSGNILLRMDPVWWLCRQAYYRVPLPYVWPRVRLLILVPSNGFAEWFFGRRTECVPATSRLLCQAYFERFW